MTDSSTLLPIKATLSLRQNMGWNLLGQIAPMLAALVSIPLLVKHIGNDRFGLLMICWMLIGYFNLFDLGLGRALTQSIASRRAQKQPVADIMQSGLALMLGLGVVAGLLLWSSIDVFVYSWLNIAPGLHGEARQSLLLLVPAMPLVVLSTGLRGLLEAVHAFRLANLVRTPLGVLTYVGPILVLPFSNSLVPIIAVLSVLRLLTVLALVWACHRALPEFGRGKVLREPLPELLRFGGWMTVSNVIGPLMVNMDRVFIGSVLSMSAVSFYSTPQEMIIRALVVPGAIAGVCFPAFAASDAASSRRVFWQSIKLLSIYVVVMLLLVWPLAGPVLRWWLNDEFARNSAPVLRCLAIGIAFNCLAHIPFAYIQGIGQSRVTALFHIVELIIYVPLVFACLHWLGLVGVALAWTTRLGIDAVLLFAYAIRRLHHEQAPA